IREKARFVGGDSNSPATKGSATALNTLMQSPASRGKSPTDAAPATTTTWIIWVTAALVVVVVIVIIVAKGRRSSGKAGTYS
ncbi:MAG TPA: hypothetical protein VF669_02535, partial [Tepidisphaeraceae bacterium]